jgi:hypothetical protein
MMRATVILLSIAVLLCIPVVPAMLVEIAAVLPDAAVVALPLPAVSCGVQPLALFAVVASRAPPAAPALA